MSNVTSFNILNPAFIFLIIKSCLLYLKSDQHCSFYECLNPLHKCIRWIFEYEGWEWLTVYLLVNWWIDLCPLGQILQVFLHFLWPIRVEIQITSMHPSPSTCSWNVSGGSIMLHLPLLTLMPERCPPVLLPVSNESPVKSCHPRFMIAWHISSTNARFVNAGWGVDAEKKNSRESRQLAVIFQVHGNKVEGWVSLMETGSAEFPKCVRHSWGWISAWEWRRDIPDFSATLCFMRMSLSLPLIALSPP